jgi:hypothetical protein
MYLHQQHATRSFIKSVGAVLGIFIVLVLPRSIYGQALVTSRMDGLHPIRLAGRCVPGEMSKQIQSIFTCLSLGLHAKELKYMDQANWNCGFPEKVTLIAHPPLRLTIKRR